MVVQTLVSFPDHEDAADDDGKEKCCAKCASNRYWDGDLTCCLCLIWWFCGFIDRVDRLDIWLRVRNPFSLVEGEV
jgi:hypothetical protein